MTEHADGQLAFDFDEMAREETRARLNEWDGAPLGFTRDYFTPAQFDEAFEHWKFLNGPLGSWKRSHMWHREGWNGMGTEFGQHRGEIFGADLGPDDGQEGPGGQLTQMICEPCDWHVITEDDNTAVEAWHDYAVPGWRDLPVVPAAIRLRDGGASLSKLAMTWITERYPDHMQVPGAPIITERSPYGTRHVHHYSPWGGYDLSHTALDRPAAPEPPVRAPRRELPPFTPASPGRPSKPVGRGLAR